MRASTVTQYGIPTSEGGRACVLKIGDVRVFLTGGMALPDRVALEADQPARISDGEHRPDS